MRWSLLKDYRCPACGNPLEATPNERGHRCTNHPTCEFFIGNVKFESLIKAKYNTRRAPTEEENLGALNNL